MLVKEIMTRNLKSVGGAHGVSPYCYYGDSSCVPFYRVGSSGTSPGTESLGEQPP